MEPLVSLYTEALNKPFSTNFSVAFVIQTLFLQSLMPFWDSPPLVGHLPEGLSARLVSGTGAWAVGGSAFWEQHHKHPV